MTRMLISRNEKIVYNNNDNTTDHQITGFAVFQSITFSVTFSSHLGLSFLSYHIINCKLPLGISTSIAVQINQAHYTTHYIHSLLLYSHGHSLARLLRIGRGVVRGIEHSAEHARQTAKGRFLGDFLWHNELGLGQRRCILPLERGFVPFLAQNLVNDGALFGRIVGRQKVGRKQVRRRVAVLKEPQSRLEGFRAAQRARLDDGHGGRDAFNVFRAGRRQRFGAFGPPHLHRVFAHGKVLGTVFGRTELCFSQNGAVKGT